jgi:WD40 repeat protein
MSAWRTVRVFISSTFRDMHSERDHLVKVVFPRLRERLEKYRIHLVDIDLRWGITEAEVNNDQALEVCLKLIDECRPFFIGILGERYGWVVRSRDESVQSRYGCVKHVEGKSITELEILYGVLSSVEMQKHAFFYFRDPSFINDVPEAKQADLWAETPEAAAKLAQLKNAIRAANLPTPPMEGYPCHYAGLRINSRLVHQKLDSIQQASLQANIKEGGIKPNEYPVLDPRLRDLVDADGTVLVGGLALFGDRVFNDLWCAIKSECTLPDTPPREELSVLDPLAEEEDYHAQLMESHLRLHVLRNSIQRKLIKFTNKDDSVPCLITGAPGSGKSALLASFSRNYSLAHPDVLVINHFIGASPASTSLQQTMRRFCMILNERFKFKESHEDGVEGHKLVPVQVAFDTEMLLSQFRAFIALIPTKQRVLFVIDALNLFDESEGAYTLHWLPQTFPDNVKLVMSCTVEETDQSKEVGISALAKRLKLPGSIPEGENRTDKILQAFARRRLYRLPVQPLTKRERLRIISHVVSLSAKRLDQRQIRILLANPATRNPLFLLVALEELRGFGSFELLTAKIRSFPCESNGGVYAIFNQVIQRLEEEFDTRSVRQILCFLACSRHGLSQRQLSDLSRDATKLAELEGTSKIGVSDINHLEEVSAIIRQLRPHLQYRADLLDFYHRGLCKAANARYLKDPALVRQYHRYLAEYFNSRLNIAITTSFSTEASHALSELPFHLFSAGMNGQLVNVLTDFSFLEAKCTACSSSIGPDGKMIYEGVYDLLSDLEMVIARDDLVAEGPAEVLRSLYEKLRPEAYIIRKNPQSFSQQIHNSLVKPMSPHEQLLLDLILAKQASAKRPWFKVSPADSESSVQAERRRILNRGSLHKNLAIAPGGHECASSHAHGAVRWDLVSGRPKNSFVFPQEVEVRHRNPSGFLRRLFQVWRHGNTSEVGLLKASKRYIPYTETRVACLSWGNEGRSLIGVGYNGVVCVWDIETREVTEIWDTGGKLKRAYISQDYDRMLVIDTTGAAIWDLAKKHRVGGIERENIENGILAKDGRTAYLVGAAPQPPGALLSTETGELLFWDLESKETNCFELPSPFFARLTSVVLIPEQNQVIAVGDSKGTVALIELRTMSFTTIFPGELLGGYLEGFRRKFTKGGSRVFSEYDRKADPVQVALVPVTGPDSGLYRKEVGNLVTSSDGRLLAAGGSEPEAPGRLAVFDLNKRRIVRQQTLPNSVQSLISISCDEELIVSCTNLLFTEPFGQNAKEEDVTSFARGYYLDTAASDGAKYLALASYSDILVIDVMSAKTYRHLFAHKGKTLCLDWHPEGRFLASGGDDGLCILWDMSTGERVVEFASSASAVGAVRFTPEGGLLCILRANGLIEIADWKKKSVRRLQEECEISWNVAAISRGGLLVTGGRHCGISNEATCWTWELNVARRAATFDGHTGRIQDIGFCGDGTVATVATDRSLRLWAPLSGQQLRSWNLEEDPLAFVCLPNDRGMVVASTDGTCTLWIRDREEFVAQTHVKMACMGIFSLEKLGLLMTVDGIGRRTYFDLAAL